MKRTLLTIGIISIICFLLIVRLFSKQHHALEDERAWFANAVGYEFSAHIDSIRMLNETTGRLWCRIGRGHPDASREDSLKALFKEHDMLYMIFKQAGDSITLVLPYANAAVKGDCLQVSSHDNIVRIFHERQQVVSQPLTKTLMGYSRPFFLKRKNR